MPAIIALAVLCSGQLPPNDTPRPVPVAQVAHFLGPSRVLAASNLIVSLDVLGLVVLWDVTTGKSTGCVSLTPGTATSAIALAPDAQRLYVAVADRIVCYSIPDGTVLTGWSLPTDSVSTLAVTPSGDELVGAGEDGAIHVWDTRTLQKKAHADSDDSGSATCLAVSPNGEIVAVGYDNGSVQLRTVKDASLRKALNRHRETVNCVAFSPDGRLLLTGSDDYSALVWDLETDGAPRVVRTGVRPIESVAFTGSGDHIVTATSDRTCVSRTVDATPNHEVSFPGSTCVIGYGSGSSIALCTDTGVSLLDAASGATISELRGYSSIPAAIEWEPQGRFVMVSTANHYTSIVDLHTLHETRRFEGSPAVWSSDASKILVAVDGDTPAELIEVASGKTLARVRVNQPSVTSLAISPGDRFAALGSNNNTVVLWNLETSREACRVEGNGCAFSPDGSLLATSGPDTRVRLYSVPDGAKVAEFSDLIREPVHGNLVFSADGKYLAVGTHRGFVVLDVSAQALIRELSYTEVGSISLSRSHNGRQVVAADPNGAVVVNADGWEKTLSISSSVGLATCASISPDGTMIALGGILGVALYSADGKHVVTLLPCNAGAIAMTPDGYYTAPRDVLPAIAFRVGQRALPADEYDAVFNRPDLVYETWGLVPPHIRTMARRAVERRIARLGLENPTTLAHAPPLLRISWLDSSLSTPNRSIVAEVSAETSGQKISSIEIRANGVPVRLAELDTAVLADPGSKVRLEIPLIPGNNRIHIVAVDASGIRSSPVVRNILCTARSESRDLYVLAIGVSRYEAPGHDLTFANKDARDLCELLARSWKHGEIKVKLLLDQDATARSISEAGHFLEAARPDDTVVVFLAGHGLLDGAMRFYFAAHDVDFANPQNRGIPYDVIETMLERTAARQKLLLVDACHAGTLAVETLPGDAVAQGPVRGAQPWAVEKPPPTDIAPFLRDLLVDIGGGSGTIVIAAAAGEEYAYEEKGNGVFTFSVLEGLKYRSADSNRDGSVSVHELRAYVGDRVRYLTGWRQSPSPRNYNPEFDFTLL